MSHLTATIRAKADETDRFAKNGRANFGLNVMLPVIATNLLESIELLATPTTLANKALATFVVREDN